MTEASPIGVEHTGPISTLTVQRPGALNALNRATLEALAAAIASLRTRAGLGCVIVTGAGDKAFVAGADIAEMSGMGPAEAKAFAELGQSAFAALEALPVPVIAAVNGFALGGGCELALACDFIYAGSHAKFGQPEVKLGVIPGFGGTQRLSRRIGLGMARELIYTGRMIGPEEALRIGLVNAVYPRTDLLAKVRETAESIAAVGPSAVSAAKQVIEAAYHLPLVAAVAAEAESFGRCFGAEQQEGMSAFLAKRAPQFPPR
ncbi:MAG: enoyl-CoA hydratase-related protein [Polyangiales bacterium]